jgi:DNA-binding response OmpR family regulator
MLPPIRKKHILVVEDETLIRQEIKLGLEQNGYEVSEAHSTTSLLGRLTEPPPVDLITLDLMLGDDDGLALASTIRQQFNIPIIMLTARSGPGIE